MNSIVTELSNTDLFRGVPIEVLEDIVTATARLELAEGEVLLSPTRDNEHVYLLLSGRFALHFGSVDTPEIRELEPGVAVGEMSVLGDSPPTAFVVAKEPASVLPIHRDTVIRLVDENNPVARNLMCMMGRWLKANTTRIIQDQALIWELANRANVDSLTALYNRRWLGNAFPRLLEQAHKEAQPLCVLLIDVDRFKDYNDAFGHQGGDRALVAVGEVLKTAVRPYDFPCRYGGEEFLVMLPNTDLEQGVVVAERIRQAMASKRIMCIDGTSLGAVTLSIGVAVSAADSTTESLVADADAQLYRAKNGGRNRTCF